MECKCHERKYQSICISLRDSFEPVNFMEACMQSWDLDTQYTTFNITNKVLKAKMQEIIDETEDNKEPDLVKPFEGLSLQLGGNSVKNSAFQFIFKAQTAIRTSALTPLMDMKPRARSS